MRLRIKLYYLATGFQIMGAFFFALMGRLPYALMAVFFAITSWYAGEYWLNEEIKHENPPIE